jgi:hypothetical protein
MEVVKGFDDAIELDLLKATSFFYTNWLSMIGGPDW